MPGISVGGTELLRLNQHGMVYPRRGYLPLINKRVSSLRGRAISFGGTEGRRSVFIKVGTKEVEESVDEKTPDALVPLPTKSAPDEAQRIAPPGFHTLPSATGATDVLASGIFEEADESSLIGKNIDWCSAFKHILDGGVVRYVDDGYEGHEFAPRELEPWFGCPWMSSPLSDGLRPFEGVVDRF